MEDKLEDSECDYELDYLPQQLYQKICISILEETLHQLNILKVLHKIPVMPQVYETYRTIEERFSKCVVKSVEEESMSKEQSSLSFFQKNFAIIETALKITYDEFQKNGSFDKLVDIIKVHNMLKRDEGNLIMDTQRRQKERKKLVDDLNREKIFYHNKIEEVMAAIENTRDKIENFIIENKIKIKYINDWQNAKTEELDIALERKEESIKNVNKTTEAEIFREIRIHEEILLAVAEMQKDLEHQIGTWKEKYNKSIKELDHKIKNLKEKREEQNIKRNQLEGLYLNHQQQIYDYKQYKIEQERIKEELKIKNKAATKIQAWWRGTMVRKGFGKFRKKKDKKLKKRNSEMKVIKTIK